MQPPVTNRPRTIIDNRQEHSITDPQAHRQIWQIATARGWRHYQPRVLSLGILAIALIVSTAIEVAAAETVLLRYRIFGRSIPVSDLAVLAETGEAPESLAGLLAMAGQDPQDLQRLLSGQVDVNPTLADRTLNSWPGEWVLDQLGTAIHPPSEAASRQALRAAIVLSAADDGQISLLEILQRYPTPQVVVEGDRIESAYRQLANLLSPLQIF